MSSAAARAALLAACAVAASGCVSVEMGRLGDRVAADVERQPGVEVGRGSASAIGRGTIGTGRFLSRLFAPKSTEPFRRLTRHVKGVKIARYAVAGPFDGRALGSPDWVAEFEADGWLPLVTVRDKEAFVVVSYREDGDRVTDVLAVTVAEEDLVLTKFSGDLTALVLDAIAMGSEVDVNGRPMLETLFGGPDEAPEADPADAPPPADPGLPHG